MSTLFNQTKSSVPADLTVGTQVLLDIPADHRLKKYHRKTGIIEKVACKWNPYPIVKLESGHRLAVERKFLKRFEQQSLF